MREVNGDGQSIRADRKAAAAGKRPLCTKEKHLKMHKFILYFLFFLEKNRKLRL